MFQQIAFVGVNAGNATGDITISSNWNSPSGSSPQSTLSRTLSIPGGNPGSLRFVVTFDISAPTYAKNSDPDQALSDGLIVTAFANSDGLSFKLTGASRTCGITVYDNTTGALIGACSISNT